VSSTRQNALVKIIDHGHVPSACHSDPSCCLLGSGRRLGSMWKSRVLGWRAAVDSEPDRDLNDHHERVTVTVHGRPSAVLVAVEDLERLEGPRAIMRDADTLARLAQSDAELARGE